MYVCSLLLYNLTMSPVLLAVLWMFLTIKCWFLMCFTLFFVEHIVPLKILINETVLCNLLSLSYFFMVVLKDCILQVLKDVHCKFKKFIFPCVLTTEYLHFNLSNLSQFEVLSVQVSRSTVVFCFPSIALKHTGYF